MENNIKSERNILAAKYGLLTGLIFIVITSAITITVSKFLLFMGLGLLAFILYFFIIGIFAKRIRKATGGYFDFKEAFGVIFIMISISVTMAYIYDSLYMFVIDPGYIDKIKNSTLTFLEGFNPPQATYDKVVKQMEDSTADARKFAPGQSVLMLLRSIITHTIVGLLVCLIVKKKKPDFVKPFDFEAAK